MKNKNKNIHIENSFTANINNSNDFNRILDEIKLKQLQSEKVKIRNNTKPKIKAIIENESTDNKEELEKNTMKHKEILNKNTTHRQKYIRKYKSDEKIKKKNFEDTTIFPHVTSLILDHGRKNKDSEYSNSIKNVKDTKIKKNISNQNLDNHTIYDIYANTLKKLSVKDNVLKEHERRYLSINDKKISEIRKNKLSEGIKNKKNMNLINTGIRSNSFDESSSNSMSINESNNAKKRENLNQQKQRETHKNKSSLDHNYHYNNDKRNCNTLEIVSKSSTYSNDNKLYYNNSSVEDYDVVREHNYNNDNFYEAEKIKGKKKGKKEKRQLQLQQQQQQQQQTEKTEESEEKEDEKRQHEELEWVKQNECEYETYSKHEGNCERSIEMERNCKSNTNESESLKSDDLKSREKKNYKKTQKMHIKNSRKSSETEKENDYLKTPFVLSIECLDENEKQGIKNIEMKNKNNQIMNLNHNDILNNFDEDMCHRNKPLLETVKNIPVSNMYYSLKDKTYKNKKKSYEKKDRNYSKSEVTTIDSEYSFNENLNISYENLKTKNKNKIFSIVNEKKNKEDLLKIINSQNISTFRKILRVMRELYIGFIGIHLIYFMTYILFGNNSVYLIEIISLSCTFFSLLDANYHGYLLNGFIDLFIAIFLNVAVLKNISGFKTLQADDVLKNIAISNIVILYFFSVFSFVNSYFIFKLHSLEKRSIKHIIQKIESKAEKNF